MSPISFNGNEYIQINASSFSDGKAQAQALGGHLVSINTQEELTFIVENFANQGKHVWTGANDIDEEGEWVWTDGSSNNLLSEWDRESVIANSSPRNLGNGTLWGGWEPDGLITHDSDQDVAIISSSTGKLHDVDNK